MMSFSANRVRLSSGRPALPLLVFVIAVSAGQSSPARAEGGEERPADGEPARDAEAPASGGVSWSYLVGGGAVPFAYGSAAAYLSLKLLVSPRESPLWFSASEGGAEMKSETVATYFMYGAIGIAPVAIALSGTDSRWYHAKGMLESVATTALLTEIAKNTFGRHRPYYDPATSTDDTDRKSFFSGHASNSLALTTYAGLYLHNHLFARWRGADRAFAWWETFPLAALAGLAVYVPYTRVADNRHHVSDVLTGAGVGLASSIAFYAWQEARYRRARSALAAGADQHDAPTALILPTFAPAGASLLLFF